LLSPPTLAAQTFIGDNLCPAWSRDGKYLAYASRRRSIGPHHFVFAIRSLETGEVREVSPSPAIDQVGSVIWAPDGRSLIVNRRDVKGRYGIFWVDAQTGKTSILVEQKKAKPFRP
jgi:Tol biopolymer transport system component